jgi:secreted trypsin-like serine protease
MVLKVDDVWKLVGIVSAALPIPVSTNGRFRMICDLENYIVYTDVSKFYHWISQVIGETS